jgi:cellulose synthase operon protein C
MQKFPESAELYNNAALHYMQTSVSDSTNYYFQLAQQHTDDVEFVRSNRLAFYTRLAMLDEAENLLNQSGKGKYKPLRSNIIVLKSLLGKEQDKADFVPDSLEQVEDFVLFYNQTLNSLKKGDTTRLKSLNKFLGNRNNQLFFEDLLYSKALVHHYNGKPKEARNIVENLALASSDRVGYYYNTLGIWMLEERNPLAGAYYFERAKNSGFADAFLSHGYALARAHQPKQAVAALGEVGYTENEEAKADAEHMAVILQQNVQSILTLAGDSGKVQYLATYWPQLQLSEVDALVHSVQEKNLRRYAALHRIDYLLQKKLWKQADRALKEAGDQFKPEDELRSQLNLKQMWWLVETQNFDILLNRLDKLYLTNRDERYKLFFRAKIAEVKNRDREAAERYTQAIEMLLYDEKVITEAANFFSRYKPREMAAYNILLNGVIYNPFSPVLQKAYALESLNKGLYSYAKEAADALKDLLPATEYSTFIQKFEERRQELETNADNWQL